MTNEMLAAPNPKTWKSAEEAAKAFHAWLLAQAEAAGYDLEGVWLLDPEETERGRGQKVWGVCWEDGPFEWAGAVSMGESLHAREFDLELGLKRPGPFPRGINGEWGMAEPHYSFDLLFFPGRSRSRQMG